MRHSLKWREKVLQKNPVIALNNLTVKLLTQFNLHPTCHVDNNAKMNESKQCHILHGFLITQVTCLWNVPLKDPPKQSKYEILV